MRVIPYACSLVLVGVTTAATAGEPLPGEYGTQPGHGTLAITRKAGALHYALIEVGVNGHVCELQGTVSGETATTTPDDSEPCVSTFSATGDRISVGNQTADACRAYCGMRASFDTDYIRFPARCNSEGREDRNRAFLSDYRAARYDKALATLAATKRDCGAFFDWLERDARANDEALTLHHLGRDAQCLAVLGDTLVADNADEDALREDFWPAPTDWDAYLPIAKAIWHNRSLCGGDAEPRQSMPPGT